ncbi:MAG: cytochrome c-type biogenesis protein [Paracoccaceae bacterium]
MLRYLSLILMLATPLYAVQPNEILEDPVLEARARDISKGLRCLVCRNENIDDSNAGLARDLRLLVRERLIAGDGDKQVVAYVVARYGEYVLLKPVFNARNALLWLAAPILLLMGGGISYAFIRRQSRKSPPKDGLNADEKKRLAALLDD